MNIDIAILYLLLIKTFTTPRKHLTEIIKFFLNTVPNSKYFPVIQNNKTNFYIFIAETKLIILVIVVYRNLTIGQEISVSLIRANILNM